MNKSITAGRPGNSGAAVRPGRLNALLVTFIFLQLLLVTLSLQQIQVAQAATLPSGFNDSVVFSGLTQPTVVQFASDGRVFVAEKSGLIKVFDNFSDTTPTIFADLRTNVHNFWDRGLLGMVLDPAFPVQPYIHVLYTYDAAIGGTAPRWGVPGATSDGCPNPPGATGDGCVVSGRLSRLTAEGNSLAGPEQVLIEDWCQQYPSHSIGALAYGADGALYVSGGDGASFNFTDYGQDGNPLNPCGDPPGGVGATLTPPTAEGGALRSQSLRSAIRETASLDGTVLRVDPATGLGWPGNPLATSADPNKQRVVAFGQRNPFRLAIRPGTNEVWTGDVGWNNWEEINRISNPTAPATANFGWPCYEGDGRQSGYDGANLNLCESLYTQTGAITAPYYAYNHSSKVVAGETCPTGSSSIAGLAFYNASGGRYPSQYNGALFFADYSRDCIWAMLRGSNGLPDPNNRLTLVAAAANPVNLQIGPAGDLFYVDYDGGTIRRIQYQAPTASFQAAPTLGTAPLTVNFDGSASSDPDPAETLAYSWDLNGDGQFGDSTIANPTYTYTTPGSYSVRLTVTNSKGISSTSQPTVITANNTAPVATINTPSASLTWKVGDVITFSGSATDQQDGALPASALSWALNLQHCPSNCHAHTIQTFSGVSSGSFSAPDHEYPSYLELSLTATDSGGLTGTRTVRLDSETVALNFESSPSGLQLTVGSTSGLTPFSRTVIVGSTNSVSAPSPQTLSNVNYVFSNWSDGGAQTHNITAGAGSATYTANYSQATLLGNSGIGSIVDSNRPRMAVASQYLAGSSGTMKQAAIYLDAGNASSQVVVGLYTNTAANNPGTLLAKATINQPANGAWNTVNLASPVTISAGQRYWIAILGTANGSIKFRSGQVGGPAQLSAQNNLRDLPATWTPGKSFPNSQMSAYFSS